MGGKLLKSGVCRRQERRLIDDDVPPDAVQSAMAPEALFPLRIILGSTWGVPA